MDEIKTELDILKAELNDLYTRFLLIRQKIEQEGMTKELLVQQSDLCFNIQNTLATVEEQTKEETHDHYLCKRQKVLY